MDDIKRVFAKKLAEVTMIQISHFLTETRIGQLGAGHLRDRGVSNAPGYRPSSPGHAGGRGRHNRTWSALFRSHG